MPMDPARRTDAPGAGVTFTAKRTYRELEEENAALKDRIAELEAQLGITSATDEA